ncbi:MAG TPA: ABC transporter ATP-binding protein [Acidobacteriota bacterium]|nr:ABC transporter ATP-binding protein [Acidobacteriota bacterium]
MNRLLEVRGLRTVFHTEEGDVPAVDGISFHVQSGEVVGVVGESGCGKSVTSLSILRLVTPPGEIVGGEILFEGRDLLKKTEKEMQAVRGNKISMIFQEPMTSLNPVMKIGDQVAESLVLHKGMSLKKARSEAVDLLRAVSIPDPEARVNDYAHQLSGGMRQRVMIAIAIACHPVLLIADEPTTALDVTIQAQILDLLNALRREYGLSILLITHALGVVAEIADRVIVMYAGKVVEEAPVLEIFSNPRHPYTMGLLDSIPRLAAGDVKQAKLKTIEGTVPNLLQLPQGCSFYDRCRLRSEICTTRFPDAVRISETHTAACYAVSS